jgi:hypothetical protein
MLLPFLQKSASPASQRTPATPTNARDGPSTPVTITRVTIFRLDLWNRSGLFPYSSQAHPGLPAAKRRITPPHDRHA